MFVFLFHSLHFGRAVGQSAAARFRQAQGAQTAECGQRRENERGQCGQDGGLNGK